MTGSSELSETHNNGELLSPEPERIWGKRGEIISPACPKSSGRGGAKQDAVPPLVFLSESSEAPVH